MNKKKTRRSRAQRVCGINDVQAMDLYEKGKLLLEIYRGACWSAWNKAEEVKSGAQMSLASFGYAGDDLDRALVYLETFAPENGRDAFENRMRELFETKWMMDIVEAAMEKVKGFPKYGELYCKILEAYYLGETVYSESEMLDMLGMERSSFYRKKKEAILVFGFAVWGASIDDMRTVIERRKEKECVQLTFF